MLPEIETIAAALVVAVEEDDKLLPYKKREKAPGGFAYEKQTLIQPEDARTIWQAMKKIDELDAKKDAIVSQSKAIRDAANKASKAYEEEQGLENVHNEIQSITNKLGSDVNAVDKELGGALLEYKNRVYAVYDVIKEGKVKDKEQMDMLVTLLKAAVAPAILDPIMEKFGDVVKAEELARTEYYKEFGSWPSRADLRKLVKQEIPKGEVVTSGVWDSLKSFFSKAVNELKSIFSPVEDAAADAVSAIQQADPILDEAEAIIGGGAATAAKKTAADRHETYDDVLTMIAEAEKQATSSMEYLDDIGRTIRSAKGTMS